MIVKWRLDSDQEISNNTKYYQGIRDFILYITSIKEEDEKDDASPITKAHNIVLLFKFISSFCNMEIEHFPMNDITRYLEKVKVDGSLEFVYFAKLLT